MSCGVRNYFKSRPLFHDCMILLDVSDYRNPLWDSFTKSHSYKLSEKERRESKIDYLILNS